MKDKRTIILVSIAAVYTVFFILMNLTRTTGPEETRTARTGWPLAYKTVYVSELPENCRALQAAYDAEHPDQQRLFRQPYAGGCGSTVPEEDTSSSRLPDILFGIIPPVFLLGLAAILRPKRSRNN